MMVEMVVIGIMESMLDRAAGSHRADWWGGIGMIAHPGILGDDKFPREAQVSVDSDLYFAFTFEAYKGNIAVCSHNLHFLDIKLLQSESNS